MKRKTASKVVIQILLVAIVTVAIIVTWFILKENGTNNAEPVIQNPVGTEESKFSIKFSYGSDDYWTKLDMTNAGYKTQGEYETAVLNYIDEIAKLLGKEDWYKQYTNEDNTIYLNLELDLHGAEELPYLKYPEKSDTKTLIFNLNYPIGMITYCDLPLVNALTHLVTYDKQTGVSSFSKTLDDGLCDYVQNHYYSGKGIMICDRPAQEAKECNYYVIDVHKVVKLEQRHTSLAFEKLDTENNGFAMRYRYSFVDYLIQTYGLEAVMKVHDGLDESAYNSLSKNGYSGLISDWKQFLSKYADFTSSEAQIESDAWESNYYLYRRYFDFKY
ncbi:hypothetical protein [[Clostridium] fimetarium]|uniref:Uncharacterized protein n=1 Tax=[Clostridium] fimetarium TaxID=99656 RepID=A0A1I0PJ35_9FIRM|nr:hypothetical protein [[Clostridium] fimetarium]SEW14391.1 hypothetical protein SAMN05421659_105124 [[Clostridium] fimetarium]